MAVVPRVRMKNLLLEAKDEANLTNLSTSIMLTFDKIIENVLFHIVFVVKDLDILLYTLNAINIQHFDR